jgi:hypothetical protein
MSRLFGRRWTITIDTIQVTELDMSFRCKKTIKPDPNTCELTVYNLNAVNRAHLEELRPKKDALVGIPVKIEAGYADAQSLIWLGDLRTVETKPDGSTWVTELSSGDGEKACKKARVSQSFGPATSPDTVLRALAHAMGIGVGNLEFFAQKQLFDSLARQITSQGLVISGSAAKHLTRWAKSSNLEWSIQDGALQFTDRGKPLPGKILLLNSETGLIGTPTVDNEGLLTVTMLMIPDVLPGSLLVLDSERIKGNYRIREAEYEGDTSGQPWYITAVCERI